MYLQGCLQSNGCSTCTLHSRYHNPYKIKAYTICHKKIAIIFDSNKSASFLRPHLRGRYDRLSRALTQSDFCFSMTRQAQRRGKLDDAARYITRQAQRRCKIYHAARYITRQARRRGKIYHAARYITRQNISRGKLDDAARYITRQARGPGKIYDAARSMTQQDL